jgi:hypothetical protein
MAKPRLVVALHHYRHCVAPRNETRKATLMGGLILAVEPLDVTPNGFAPVERGIRCASPGP